MIVLHRLLQGNNVRAPYQKLLQFNEDGATITEVGEAMAPGVNKRNKMVSVRSGKGAGKGA